MSFYIRTFICYNESGVSEDEMEHFGGLLLVAIGHQRKSLRKRTSRKGPIGMSEPFVNLTLIRVKKNDY
jgi:hypothetical protein